MVRFPIRFKFNFVSINKLFKIMKKLISINLMEIFENTDNDTNKEENKFN